MNSTTAAASGDRHNLPPPPPRSSGRRYRLEAEQEVRIEVNIANASAGVLDSVSVILQRGSAEVLGHELALQKAYRWNLGGAGSGSGGGSAGAAAPTTTSLTAGNVPSSSAPAIHLPIYTFHGCVIDVSWNASELGAAGNDDHRMEEEGEGGEDAVTAADGNGGALPSSLSMYVVESDDTSHHIAYVNTHAQLEALRDEALLAAAAPSSSLAAAAGAPAGSSSTAAAAVAATGPHMSPSQPPVLGQGPRVLVVGSSASGKSSLVQTLLNYALKLGRTPLWVDLNVGDNAISVPGTLCVTFTSRDSLLLSSLPQLVAGGGGCPGGGSGGSGSLSPLCLWHGCAGAKANADLFRAQVAALGRKINSRLQVPDNVWERSSGVLVDAPSFLSADEHYSDLVRTIRDMNITVVLLTGHDKLYAKLRAEFHSNGNGNGGSVAISSGRKKEKELIVVKLPRSGGVVERDAKLLRSVRSRTIRRYFYGEASPPREAGSSADSASASLSATTTNKGGSRGLQRPPPSPHPSSHYHPVLTPFLAQLKFDQIRLYQVTSMSLSSSLLPLGAQQTTDIVQLQPVPITELITHKLLAVCHPRAVHLYDETGESKCLYESGVTGFVVVERVLVESETVHLLAPCAGSLPSHTLLVGDITWMD